jgi:ribose 5-phosphate isomerase RpiB
MELLFAGGNGIAMTVNKHAKVRAGMLDKEAVLTRYT